MTVRAEQVVEAGNTLRAEAESRMIPYVEGGMTTDGLDCQGLCEYLLMQCGMRKNEVNMAGTNEHIRKSVKWFGTIEECVALFGYVPAGAWIYIWMAGYNAKYNDQLGNAAHMGQLLDDGYVLHASASRGRVLISDNRVLKKSIKNGGWNAVLLARYIRFSDDIEQKLGNTTQDEEEDGTMSLANKACVVTGGSLKLRPTKSTNGVWLAQMPEGAEVIVTADDGKWATAAWFDPAKMKTVDGYALSQYLTEKTAAATTAAEETEAAQAAPAVVVTGSGVWIPTPTPQDAVALSAILKTAQVKQA